MTTPGQFLQKRTAGVHLVKHTLGLGRDDSMTVGQSLHVAHDVILATLLLLRLKTTRSSSGSYDVTLMVLPLSPLPGASPSLCKAAISC